MSGSVFVMVCGVSVLGLLGLYGLACVILSKKQVTLLYNPPLLEPGHDDHEIILPKDDTHPALRGWVDNPGQRAALLYCGGSSESIELRRSSLAQAFPSHTRYVMPYRGFGPNFLLIPTEQSIKADAERLFGLSLKTHEVVDVVGRSLGTSVAAHLAARYPVRKLALITPFDSIVSVAKLRYKFIPVGKILRDHHDVWKDAKSITAPVLACLADLDVVTPRHLWEKLKINFTKSPNVFHDEQSDHSSIAQSAFLWEALGKFFSLDEVLNEWMEDHSDFEINQEKNSQKLATNDHEGPIVLSDVRGV